MKICMLSVFFLVLIDQDIQAASPVINNYYNTYNGAGAGSNSTLLVKLMKSLLTELRKTNSGTCPKVAKNCYDILQCGGKQSGVYYVNPDGKGGFEVYCDQQTSGGGWTVIQKRKDGSVDFYRGWNDYKHGFGDLKGEFWLGLDKINRLTHQTNDRLRVDLEDTTGKTAYAEYDSFAVASEQAKYKLSIGKYSGTAGDSLSGHRNFPFSTKDQDNDANTGSCAVTYKGAWWYTSCHASNLNGLYHHGKHKSYADGVNWAAWKGHHYSAKKAEMKIRPADKKRK